MIFEPAYHFAGKGWRLVLAQAAEIKPCNFMKQITVLLAEDHTIVREGFRKMLELEADIEVVGEARTAARR